MGRPSDYTDATAATICERLMGGESLATICSDQGMPDKATVFRWLAKHVDFRDRYARARETQAEVMAEEILEIADDTSHDVIRGEEGEERMNGEYVQRSRLRVDTRKWLMARLAPKKYGDRLTHAGDDTSPVVINVVKRGGD